MRGKRYLAAGGIALAASILPVGTVSAAPASHRPTPARVLSCPGKVETRPAYYVMSCADYNARWQKVHWETWGSAKATGRGELYENTCTPSCAGGRFVTYPAKVTLSAVVRTKKYGLLYSKATFNFFVDGRAREQTFGLAT